MMKSLFVLILDDGRAGHVNPCLGLIDALQQTEASMHIKSTTLKINPKHRFVVSLIKRLSHTFIPLWWWIKRLYYFEKDTSIDTTAIDLVVCSGMPSLCFAVAWVEQYGGQVAYVGNVRGFSSKKIHHVISAVQQSHLKCPQWVLATPPVRGAVLALRTQPPNTPPQHALLLIGAATAQYPFSTTDWQILVQNFAQTCTQYGIKGSLSTSRRTGLPLENQLSEAAAQHRLTLYRFNQYDAPSYISLLAQNDIIYVSEDSTSMLSEALQSGRAVASLHPDTCKVDQLTKTYTTRGLLRCNLNYAPFAIPQPQHHTDQYAIISDFIQQVLKHRHA